MMSKAIRPGWKQGESNIQKSVDLKSNWSHFKSNISEMVNPFPDVIIFFPKNVFEETNVLQFIECNGQTCLCSVHY